MVLFKCQWFVDLTYRCPFGPSLICTLYITEFLFGSETKKGCKGEDPHSAEEYTEETTPLCSMQNKSIT